MLGSSIFEFLNANYTQPIYHLFYICLSNRVSFDYVMIDGTSQQFNHVYKLGKDVLNLLGSLIYNLTITTMDN